MAYPTSYFKPAKNVGNFANTDSAYFEQLVITKNASIAPILTERKDIADTNTKYHLALTEVCAGLRPFELAFTCTDREGPEGTPMVWTSWNRLPLKSIPKLVGVCLTKAQLHIEDPSDPFMRSTGGTIALCTYGTVTIFNNSNTHFRCMDHVAWKAPTKQNPWTRSGELAGSIQAELCQLNVSDTADFSLLVQDIETRELIFKALDFVVDRGLNNSGAPYNGQKKSAADVAKYVEFISKKIPAQLKPPSEFRTLAYDENYPLLQKGTTEIQSAVYLTQWLLDVVRTLGPYSRRIGWAMAPARPGQMFTVFVDFH